MRYLAGDHCSVKRGILIRMRSIVGWRRVNIDRVETLMSLKEVFPERSERQRPLSQEHEGNFGDIGFDCRYS